MLKKHNPEWDSTEINHINCRRITGYDYFKLLRLTGHTAISARHPLLWHNVQGKYPAKIKLKVQCKRKAELRRILNIKDRSLRNDLFRGVGLAKEVFQAQIHFCRIAGIKFFKVLAYRSDENSKWNGYRIWPWYGFLMDVKSKEEFDLFLAKHDLPKMTIMELYKLEADPSHPHLLKGGYELWKEKGFTWFGVFDLNQTSESMRIYREQIEK